MAKTTAKRKSESALSFGKGKQRKTAALPRRDMSESDDQETQSAQELFVQDQPVAAKHVKKNNPKSRKSEPVCATRDEEYEEDPGRVESQQFLSLVEYEAKKKKVSARDAAKYQEQLTKDLDHDEQELKTQLGDLTSASGIRDTAFLKAFKMAYTAATPCAKSKKGVQEERRGFDSMYKRSKLLTDEAMELGAYFDRVSQQVLGLDKARLMDNEWGEEDKKIAQLLEDGRDIGIAKYRNILTASKEAVLVPEEMQDAQALYENGEQQEPSAWGKVAKKEEKAIKKLVKTIAI